MKTPNTNEYDCPVCESPVTVENIKGISLCPHCKAELLFNEDADFVNGFWRNLSSLYPANNFAKLDAQGEIGRLAQIQPNE